MITRVFYWLLAVCLPVIGLWMLMSGEMIQAEMATLCVRPDGANGCYVTIQEAVNAAAPQDTILIAGGSYTETITISQTLNLVGGWQPPGWPLTQTIITGQGGNCTICVDPATDGSLSHVTLNGGTSVGFWGVELSGYALAEVVIQQYVIGVELAAPCPTAAAAYPNHTAILNHIQFQNNDLAIQVSCAYQFSVEASFFGDNDRAIASRGDRVSLQNNLFTHNGDVLTAFTGEWIVSYNTMADNNGALFTVYEDINCLEQTSITFVSSIGWSNTNSFDLVPQPACANHPAAIPYYEIVLAGSIVQGYVNYRHDPQFTFLTAVYDVNPLFWGNSDYRPRLPSAAIDGVPVGIAGVSLDILGTMRPQDGDSDGVARFDMGAYEALPGTVIRHYLPLSSR